MSVQVFPATRDQLIVTHSTEPRDLSAVRAGQWFARVAASRWRLADQPDSVRLDLLFFHDAAKSRWSKFRTSRWQSVVQPCQHHSVSTSCRVLW
jgi:hypothetical protein